MVVFHSFLYVYQRVEWISIYTWFYPTKTAISATNVCEFHLREPGFECHLTICSSLLVAKIGIERANMEDRGKLDTSLSARWIRNHKLSIFRSVQIQDCGYTDNVLFLFVPALTEESLHLKRLRKKPKNGFTCFQGSLKSRKVANGDTISIHGPALRTDCSRDSFPALLWWQRPGGWSWFMSGVLPTYCRTTPGLWKLLSMGRFQMCFPSFLGVSAKVLLWPAWLRYAHGFLVWNNWGEEKKRLMEGRFLMGMGSGTNQRTWVKHLRPRNLKFDSIAIGMFFFGRIAELLPFVIFCYLVWSELYWSKKGMCGMLLKSPSLVCLKHLVKCSPFLGWWSKLTSIFFAWIETPINGFKGKSTGNHGFYHQI